MEMPFLSTGHRGLEARRGPPRRMGSSQRLTSGAVAVLVWVGVPLFHLLLGAGVAANLQASQLPAAANASRG